MPQSTRRTRSIRSSSSLRRSVPRSTHALLSPQQNIRKRPRSGWFPWWILLVPGLLWGSYRTLANHFAKPQAIFVLGGSPDREQFAARLAQDYPDLPIWVSSGSNKEYSEWVFEQAGISPDRIHLDYRAVDTLTNFTTLMDELRAKGITSLYLVTSDYHMLRAQWISEVVGGSRGIVFKSVPIPTDQPEEPIVKSIRDSARAIVWTVTGYAGTKEERTIKE